MNFFNFFDWDQKYKGLRHHFQYLGQFIAPEEGLGNSNFQYTRLWNFLRHGLHNYRFSFIKAFTAIHLPSPWSLFEYHFHRIDTQFIEEIQAHCIRMTGVVHLERIKVLLCLPRINFLYDSILFSIICINPSLN